jgi:hypothetical protein
MWHWWGTNSRKEVQDKAKVCPHLFFINDDHRLLSIWGVVVI